MCLVVYSLPFRRRLFTESRFVVYHDVRLPVSYHCGQDDGSHVQCGSGTLVFRRGVPSRISGPYGAFIY